MTITITGHSTVAVRGTATDEVAPDEAILSVSVSQRAATAADAMARASSIASAARDAVAGAGAELKLSTLRSTEYSEWDPTTKQRIPDGHIVSTSGQIKVPASTDLAPVVAAVTGAGASLGHVSWRLLPGNEARRQVRKDAVAAAAAAAEDFADAAGAQLGALITLADPGVGARAGDTAQFGVRASGVGSRSEEIVDLDPVPQVVTVTVEASFALSPVTS
jgi:hypothetical protein